MTITNTIHDTISGSWLLPLDNSCIGLRCTQTIIWAALQMGSRVASKEKAWEPQLSKIKSSQPIAQGWNSSHQTSLLTSQCHTTCRLEEVALQGEQEVAWMDHHGGNHTQNQVRENSPWAGCNQTRHGGNHTLLVACCSLGLGSLHPLAGKKKKNRKSDQHWLSKNSGLETFLSCNILQVSSIYRGLSLIVQRVGNAIHLRNLYPVDNAVHSTNIT